MKIKFLAFFSLMFILLFSCSKNETQVSIPEDNNDVSEIEKPEDVTNSIDYFTLNVSLERDTEQYDDYIIIHDSQGILIDYKHFEKGESIVFSTDNDSITDKFTVTYLSVFYKDNPGYFLINTYGSIKKGSVWTLNEYANNHYSGAYPKTGNFTINIKGDEEKPENVYITNGSKESIKFVIPSQVDTQDWSAFINVGMEENIKDYFLTTINSTDFSKYYILENATNNANYQLDYSDFLSFDSYIDFSAPNTGSTRVTLKGYKNEDNPSSNGYTLYNITDNGFGGISSTESLKLGYLNDFFTTYSFLASYSEMGYSHYKSYYGSNLPSNYRVPEKPIVNFENRSIKNFKIDLDIDYIRTVSVWEGGEKPAGSSGSSTVWYVYANRNEFPNIGDIPEELSTKYPYLEVMEFDHLYSTFMLDSYTYDEFIQKTFVTPDTEYAPENIERITFFR